MKISQKPARIFHRNPKYIPPGATMPKVAEDACAAMRLPKSAARLMVYYATCANGFRPALQTVQKATGIDRTNISGIRKLLVNVGLIRYTPGTTGTIRIDWKRIATMAALPPEAFDGVRRSMAERLKVEQFAPAFGKSGQRWVTRYDKRRNPLLLDENKESYFYFVKSKHRPLADRKNELTRVYMENVDLKTCKKAKIYKLLLDVRTETPIHFSMGGKLHKVSNKNFEGVEENENHAKV